MPFRGRSRRMQALTLARHESQSVGYRMEMRAVPRARATLVLLVHAVTYS